MSVPFEVTILGVNSALPVFGRHPSCQIVRFDDALLMIDCGEGTQSRLSTFKIKRSRISHVFISHLHGDHCFGLPGFLTTSSLQQRKAPLNIHGPRGLVEYIEVTMRLSGSYIGYELNVIEYDTSRSHTIMINDRLSVSTIPLQHRIPTMGFKIAETTVYSNIRSKKIKEYNLSIDEIISAKSGNDIVRGDITLLNTELLVKKNKKRAYAYVSDTIYDESIVPHIQGVNVLYHETTYLDDLENLAKERFHTTLSQAINIAKLSGANKLITGHYSSRYKDITVFLTEGRKRWGGVELGEEGRTYLIE